MIRLVLKIILYIFFVVVAIEILAIVKHNEQSKRDLKYVNLDGDLLYAPLSQGCYNNPFNSKFKINSLGFNSVEPSSCAEARRVALIGDSFIAGLHVNVENSIASNIRKSLDTVCVVEFGIEGNLNDYNIIYDKYSLSDYDDVYIFLTGDADISYVHPQSMNFYTNKFYLDFLKNSETYKRIYNNYLNFRQKPNTGIIRSLPNVTYVPHFGFNTSYLNDGDFIELDTYLKVHGDSVHFKNDSHWNEFGREVVAEIIVKSLIKKYEASQNTEK